ncbi:MAG: tryptophan-rich sensory protein [Phycisphaerales bacterium]|nr:tryptophan-rich sensory protein [Phycisphaerae bacterium]NNF44966.1 tryptophan-rich sensory protein [Phycisphaerales bacterium]NNM25995.1 tryptophan-rich sensory protein [Phycisphaerales bacterium]
MRAVTPLFVFLGLVAVAAFFGSNFTPGEWYQALQRPALAPPNWIFGPVWTLLYLAIAVAAFLVWRRPERSGRALALVLWGTQLALNALWSYLFFGLERPGLALIEIVVLLGVIVATTVVFFSVRKSAGMLFVPYALWVSFATYLNAGFWYLNR